MVGQKNKIFKASQIGNNLGRQ